jgi:exonuclease SbcD
MKILHLADLHIGKKVNNFSMLDDQVYILDQILNLLDQHKPQVLIIAGDVYDKTVPSADAVSLLDDFLFKLAQKKIKTLIISGNHDSPERLSFGGRLMENDGIFISPTYDANIEPVIFEDNFGPINFYLLPFVRPVHVRGFFPEVEIKSYNDALALAIKKLEPDFSQRNILITHQFVTGGKSSDSEDISVGGADNIDANLFAGFDYVALGHLHSPQEVQKEHIRYSGSPLKYSFSESRQEKSAVLFEIKEKGNFSYELLPLIGKRDMREIKGKYEELVSKSYYEGANLEDYLHVILTDEAEVPEALGKMRTVYPNIMKLTYDNKRSRQRAEISDFVASQKRDPFEHFKDFFVLQNNQEPGPEQEKLLRKLIEEIWEEDE